MCTHTHTHTHTLEVDLNMFPLQRGSRLTQVDLLLHKESISVHILGYVCMYVCMYDPNNKP